MGVTVKNTSLLRQMCAARKRMGLTKSRGKQSGGWRGVRAASALKEKEGGRGEFGGVKVGGGGRGGGKRIGKWEVVKRVGWGEKGR